MLNQKNKYAPDVLDCIANLSNDEVFTSPKLANQMLDMVPQELFSNPRTKFLDPCCKSGVFLREIVKRLDRGLEDIIPDKQQRIDHILHKQVFGIAITELTAQLSRRTVYCSKYACAIDEDADESLWEDEQKKVHIAHSYSISEFTHKDVNAFCINPVQGNIRFNNKIKHVFDKNGICIHCGANSKSFGEESHAYELIHTKRLEELKNMQWDLIIGNPPYQLNDTSDSASASPIYNLFIEQSKKLQPRYLAMIIPSRWMVGGKGLGPFRETMLSDKHITKIHDFINSQDCFSGVTIPGGVCYFLRERDREDKCEITTHTSDKTSITKRYLKEDDVDVFVRQSELISIRNKVWTDTKQVSLATIVSVLKPYGLRTDFFTPTMKIDGEKKSVSAKEKYGLPDACDTPYEDGYEILGLAGNKRVHKYVPKDYPFPKKQNLDKYKIFVSKAYGCGGAIGEGESTQVLGAPVVGRKGIACTETFVEIGGWNTEQEALNAEKYLKTKFFRCLVGIVKQTQDASARVYKYVPMQDFTDKSDINWNETVEEIDKQLCKKYNLSTDDIEFIESNVSAMDKGTVVNEYAEE